MCTSFRLWASVLHSALTRVVCVPAVGLIGGGPGAVVPVRRGGAPHGVCARMIGEVLEHLLIIAVADPDPTLRQTVLTSFTPSFNPFLCQADNLRLLFLALNDESFRVREVRVEGCLCEALLCLCELVGVRSPGCM